MADQPANRILSMDQFRGFAIFGMLLVDYFGLYSSELIDPAAGGGATWLLGTVWRQLHHPSSIGFTFADVIAPVFMFVVGMGMRLSMLRRIEKLGVKEARRGLLKRYAIIVMLGFTIYTGYLWDALLNIGLAGMLVLWFVERKPWQRLAAGVALLCLYQFVFLYTTYGDLVQWKANYTDETMPFIWKFIPFGPALIECPINGGPLGHWSWAFMLIGGTIAYDILATGSRPNILKGLLGWGVGLLVLGLVLHAEWPGVKEAWPIAKNWTTITYALVSTGLCYLILLAFYGVCDLWGKALPGLTVLGTNPLAIYVLQWCICETGHRFINEEASWTFIIAGWFVFYGVCYGIARYLYEKKIYIKV